MTTAADILLADARASLRKEVAALAGRGDLNEAFAAWLLTDAVPSVTLEGPAAHASVSTGGLRTHQTVATLGFAADAGALSPEQTNALQEGLRWLVGRPAFTRGTPQGFVEDALALLGIAVGSRSLDDKAIHEEIARWAGGFLDQGYGFRIPDWKRCLLSAAKAALDIALPLPVPASPGTADVRCALRAKGLLPPLSREEASTEDVDALLLLTAEFGIVLESPQAVLRLAAFERLLGSVPALDLARPTIGQVCNLLRGVPGGLRRWTWEQRARTRGGESRQWHVDNEYHVQNLLYFLLFPLFPDLKEEEYVPSVGQKNPRLDLLIPSLDLIIEVKFMRASMSFPDLIEEIAADASLYLAERSGYHNIVPFVWDDTRRTEQHALLVTGLKSMRGIADAVVVARPGSMADIVGNGTVAPGQDTTDGQGTRAKDG